MRYEGVLPFYFPSTVVFVDDDEKFLKHMALNIDVGSFHRLFHDPHKALHFLTEEYKVDDFTNRYVREFEDAEADTPGLSVDIRDIRQQIFNKKRFEEISVVVLDFAMPGKNGGELAQRLKGHPFKIILLTGEADAQIAVQLFNQGLIHSYIRKDDPQFDVILNKAIRTHQQEYFQASAAIILNTLLQSSNVSHNWVKDPEFKSLFTQLCTKNHITEFYLLDEHGSYLLLDEHGKPSWLAVSNEEMMQTYLIFAEGDSAPASVIEGLKTKKLLPFFFSDTDFSVRPSEWKEFIHPAQTLVGKETYYYAYISDHKAYDIGGKIVSYDAFLQTQ